jgi:hypothetical protein
LRQHDRQLLRLLDDAQILADFRPIAGEGEEEPQTRDRAVDARGLRATCTLVRLERAQVIRRRRIGRAADEAGERLDVADIVGLGLLAELANAHLIEHATAQRADRALLARQVGGRGIDRGLGHRGSPEERSALTPRSSGHPPRSVTSTASSAY